MWLYKFCKFYKLSKNYWRALYVCVCLAQGIVQEMVKKHDKKLSDGHIDRLLAHTSSENPLWLSVACEEICLYIDRTDQDATEARAIISALPEGILK